MKQKISISLNKSILRDVDSIVDNLFIRNRSQAIEYLINESMKNNKIAVILAGESRKKTPGKLPNRYSLKIDNQTIIEKEIEKLVKWGFKTIYIISDHLVLTNIFKIIGEGNKYHAKINYIDEENQEGTASAIKLLKNKVNKTFLLVYSDTLLDNLNIQVLWNNHIKDKMTATIFASSTLLSDKEDTFAKIKLEGNKVTKFSEKIQSKKINSSIYSRGIYVLEPEIFSYPGKDLEKDIFPELVKKETLGGVITSSEHLHIHTKENLKKVKKILNTFR